MDRRAAWFNMNLNDLANLGQIVGTILYFAHRREVIQIALRLKVRAALKSKGRGD